MDKLLRKHKKVSSIVCCPRCRGPVSWDNADTYHDIPVNGTVNCVVCGIVGRIANLKIIFHAQGAAIKSARALALEGQLHVAEYLPSLADASPAGGWASSGTQIWSSQADASISLVARGEGIGLIFLKHPWAGLVKISLNGETLDTLDLFEENGSTQHWYPVYNGGSSGSIKIEVLGQKNENSQAAQVFFLGYQLLQALPSGNASILYPNANRGNPYPPKFIEMLAAQGDDAVILDCGSGDRSFPDARVVSFEYSQFSAPDVFGDGHELPFRDASFDFILSQAVIEHLSDPFLAVSEMKRVLKPGGVIYAESAFMQPLHAVPYHFYNTTGWGLANLFRDFEVQEVCHAGTLGQTLRWIYGLTQLRAKGRGEEVDTLLKLVEDLDNDITEAELRSFASFVTITARKKALPEPQEWTA